MAFFFMFFSTKNKIAANSYEFFPKNLFFSSVKNTLLLWLFFSLSKTRYFNAQNYCYFDTDLDIFRLKIAWLGVAPQMSMLFCAFRAAGYWACVKIQWQRLTKQF